MGAGRLQERAARRGAGSALSVNRPAAIAPGGEAKRESADRSRTPEASRPEDLISHVKSPRTAQDAGGITDAATQTPRSA